MVTRRMRLSWVAAVWLALVGGSPVRAQSPAAEDDVAKLAAEIDRLVAAGWEAQQITPAPLADDAEYLRRVHLDLTGRIPAVADVRDFLADASPDKRRAVVERMLSGPTYIVHYTNLWRAAMLPEADTEQIVRIFLPGFEAWLRSRIAENRNYAEIAEEVLTLPVNPQDMQGFDQGTTPTPVAFYRAKEGKVENLAAATSRVFLGVRIECAQCHDHPFDDWKRDAFWSYAAFFSEVQPPSPDMPNVQRDTRSLMIPGTEKVVPAKFLNGQEPSWEGASSNRAALAKWVVSPENPYFAKAAVNRIWAHHFGVGLVDPLDDFGPYNPPSHPELLDNLAAEFASHHFDFKFITRAITASRTYQLTSRQTDESQQSPRTFARMPVRGMTPEQIFDSLAQAVGYQQPFNPEQPINFNNDPVRQEFLDNFQDDADAPTERASTILQALQMMNGGFVDNATDLADSMTLAAVLNAPFLDKGSKVETLFLATLSRPPTAEELEKFRTYVESGGAKKDEQSALGDVFWALMNSSEFLLNH